MRYHNQVSHNNLNTHTDRTESCSGMTSAAPIPFSTKAMGYDRDQVDQYLQKLMGEYNSLQQGYADLLRKNDDLTKQLDTDMEAIGKTLVEARISAKEIVEEAKARASGLIREANQSLGLIEDEKKQLLDYIDGAVSRLKHLGYENRSDSSHRPISVSISRQ